MEAKMKSRLFPCLLFAFVERVGLRSQSVGLSESLDYSVELPQESLLAHLCLSWEYASPNAQSQVESLWSTYRVREGLFFLHLFPGMLLGQQRHHELPLTSRVPGKKTLLPMEPLIENLGRITQLSSQVLAVRGGKGRDKISNAHAHSCTQQACAYTSFILCRIPAICFCISQHTYF